MGATSKVRPVRITLRLSVPFGVSFGVLTMRNTVSLLGNDTSVCLRAGHLLIYNVPKSETNRLTIRASNFTWCLGNCFLDILLQKTDRHKWDPAYTWVIAFDLWQIIQLAEATFCKRFVRQSDAWTGNHCKRCFLASGLRTRRLRVTFICHTGLDTWRGQL